jgi:hypothetical protein
VNVPVLRRVRRVRRVQLECPDSYMEPFSTVTNSDQSRQKILGLTVLLDEAVGNITDALKVRPCCSCCYYTAAATTAAAAVAAVAAAAALLPLLRCQLRFVRLCACALCVVRCALCHLVVGGTTRVLEVLVDLYPTPPPHAAPPTHCW